MDYFEDGTETVLKKSKGAVKNQIARKTLVRRLFEEVSIIVGGFIEEWCKDLRQLINSCGALNLSVDIVSKGPMHLIMYSSTLYSVIPVIITKMVYLHNHVSL